LLHCEKRQKNVEFAIIFGVSETSYHTSQGNATYSVSSYLTALRRMIQQKIPQVWVRGTLSQVQTRGQVTYMTLAETPREGVRPTAVLQLVLWDSDRRRMERSLAESGFHFQEDLQVCVQVEADFYIPMGKFQGVVRNVDPAYTLGELALRRQRLLQQLAKEGLLKRNSSLTLSEVPLRIGLITAAGSAAHNDFLSILNDSPWNFDVCTVPARMQGKETVKTVNAALDSLMGFKPDVVCIVRGGGGNQDLIWFDEEAICRKVALYPVPVLTGIGHQIDASLTDEVAWANKITPTECAVFLARRVEESWSRLFDHGQKVGRKVTRTLEQQQVFLQHCARQIAWKVPGRLALEKQRLERNYTGLLRGPAKLQGRESQRFRAIEKQFHLQCRSALRQENEYIQQVQGQIGSLALAAIQREKDILPLKGRLLRSFDPTTPLKRGYSISRDLSGKIIRKPGDAPPGDRILVQLAQGEIQAKVYE